MPFLDSIFGRRKPTAATAESAISELEGQLRGLPGRIAEAQAKLQNLADLTDQEHAEAETVIASARREEARLKARIDQLSTARDQAAKAEAAAALRARATAAQKRVDKEHVPLIERYEARAREIVEIAEEIRAIDTEAKLANLAIEQARKADPAGSHPDMVVNSTARFRMAPDFVEPDTVVYDEKWEEFTNDSGWTTANVFRVGDDGKRKPVNGSSRLVKVERVIKGQTRKGRATPCPTYGLRLPGARLDAPAFWPRPN